MNEAYRKCTKRILFRHTRKIIKKQNRSGITSSTRSIMAFVFFFLDNESENVRHVCKVSTHDQEID
jgi:hypothetical protein